jgi:hypothetical protein
MKFYLVDGEVKFLTHKVEWEENEETFEIEFYDLEKKDALLTRLAEREITPTVTEYEQPSQDILDLVAGKKFETIAEAQALIDNPNESKIEELKAQIQATDYKIIKCSEYQLAGLPAPYDITTLHAERQTLRDEINGLEILTPAT